MSQKQIFTRKRKTLLGCFSFAFVLFLAIWLSWDKLLNAVIRLELIKRLPLTNGTTAFKFWVEPPVPVAFKIYVFDIVNPEEIMDGTERPAVIEKGPYVYRMHLKKRDIEYHDNNTVSFRQVQKFIFDREASVGPDTDNFTTVNIPFITVATILQYEPESLQMAMDAFFRANGEKTFVTLTVRDIWWGYQDPVLQDVAEVLHMLNVSSPLLNGKFGFYMDRNNTDDGLFNVYSGANHDFTNYIQIDRWNGLRELTSWKSKYANRIEGSADGSQQVPYLTADTKLSIFDTNLQRTLNLEYQGMTSYRGVDTIDFIVPFSELSYESEPDNMGFCTPDAGNCPPSGILNMSAISHMAPVCASLPHFLGGDPYLLQQVKGLKPDKAKHQPFYKLHQLTGVSLRASRRYQIVLHTKSFQGFEAFRNMPEAFIPVLWIDGLAEMPDDLIYLFKHVMQDTLEAMVYVKASFLALTCLAVVIVLALVLVWRRQGKKVYDDINSETAPLLFENQASKPEGSGNNYIGNGYVQ